MKSYVQVFNVEGQEIENFITHYTTLKGFIRYGLKNWIKSNEANSFTFSTFNNSSQLYSNNFNKVQSHTL